MGCGFSGVTRPSRVVTSSCPTALTGITQDRTTWPRMMTVQAPHCAIPQPNRGPRNPKSSLSTNKSGVSGSTLTVWRRPFTFSVICFIAAALATNESLRTAILACRCQGRDSPALSPWDFPYTEDALLQAVVMSVDHPGWLSRDNFELTAVLQSVRESVAGRNPPPVGAADEWKPARTGIMGTAGPVC